MKKNSLKNFGKNALGTMFLLMAAFLVGSTFLSMRVVLADPIAPTFGADDAANDGLTLGRQSPRNSTGRNVRATAARPTTGAATTTKTATRNVVQRPTTDIARGATARGVVSRELTRRSSRATAPTRTVRARTATTNPARVSLQGDAIRGTKTVSGTYYTYLNSKLYTGNYSNIVDSSTGLISADAYSNCLESYYTCMDEICTARNEAQRRCACAGRVKAFAEAENALNSANEELIKISGQLALLIANKGKEVSAAFELTDAERVMNCVSWREASDNGTNSNKFGDWCAEHGLFSSGGRDVCSYNQAPSYCTSEQVYGFNVANLDGAGSDILASLSAWADEVKANTDTILADNTDSVFQAMENVTTILNGIGGSTVSIINEETRDTLAETWGYDLFRYAHNNVCARVLDSCFNGIYEGCGTPPSGGRCANGATSSCPFNYNSKVTISSSGDVKLNERSNIGTAANASCFGYSSSNDPYENLRGPVADARRSVMQKYLLDANADCDLYGEQLKATAQKIAYQKVAAQQALQQKRLEFYNNERDEVLSKATAAGTNFNECISELWDCYETQAQSNENWPDARIKTYCAQIANVPHCYQDMICNPSYAQFRAIIDKPDGSCTWNASDYTANTCRNIVTLNEILNGASSNHSNPPMPNGSGNSADFREQCLLDALGCPGDGCIRSWRRSSGN